jgi:thioesterase domain-containing protein/acyl carrier protein
MLPRRVVALERLPLTVTGKVDRQALAAWPEPGIEEAPPVCGADRIEEALAELFRDLLGRPAGPQDSFFELGGDSLLAVDAALRIEEVFGLAAPPALLRQAPTPRLLAEALPACQASPHPLTLLRPGEEALPPLFCLADVFARPFSYLSLARRLQPGRAVWGLSPGALERPFAQSADLAALTDGLLAEITRVRPHGPYVLVGYSAGGLPAFDLARRLRARDEAVRLILLDSPRRVRPSLRAFARSLLAGGRWRARVGRAGRAALALSRRFAPPPLPDWLPPERRPYAAAMAEAHRRYGGGLFDGPALVVRCREREEADRLLDPDGLLGWRKALTGPVTEWTAEANHHSLMRDPLAAALARRIDLWLEGFAADQARPAA